MFHGMHRDVFCQLEGIANGTLVHFYVPIENKNDPRRGDMRAKIQREVNKELGMRPPVWTVLLKTMYCKTTEEVVASVKEAQEAQHQIEGLRTDGLLDVSPMGGISEYLTPPGAQL